MKIDRMISIIMLLRERKRVIIPELARFCKVTTHTIQRDLDTINLVVEPIVSFLWMDGGVDLVENYKFEKGCHGRRPTLLMGLCSIRASFTGNEEVNVLTKIKGMIPKEQRKALELKTGKITIDTTPWAGGRTYGDLIALYWLL